VAPITLRSARLERSIQIVDTGRRFTVRTANPESVLYRSVSAPMLRSIMTLLMSVMGAVPLTGMDGRLAGIREEVQADAVDSNCELTTHPTTQKKSRLRDDPSKDSPFDVLLSIPVVPFLVGTTAMFWAPRLMMGDVGLEGYFANYPYYEYCETGHVVVEPLKEPFSFANVSRLGGFFARDYISNVDDITSWSGRMLVDTSWCIGIDADSRYLVEELPFGIHDDLWLGDVNLVHRFAQSSWGSMRLGVGVNWLSDQ